MAQQENNATHWVLGGALLLIGLFVFIALVMIRSQAQDITATINNAAPTISGGTAKLCAGTTTGDNASISACSDLASVTLTAGSTLSVSYFVTVSDTNGIDDVDATATGVYYKSTTTSGCTADNNNCYRDDATCAKITPTISSTSAWFRCDYALEYYTDETVSAGNWVGYLTVADAATASASDSTYTNEVAKLVAGTFPTVAFGSVALGFQSATGDNQDVTHKNNGDIILDIQAALDNTDTNSAVDCSTGTIPVGNFTFDTDQDLGDVGYATATYTLTTTAQDLNIDIAQRTNDTASQGPNNPVVAGDDQMYSYWNISVPSTGVLGSCTEALNVTFKEAP